MSVLSKTRTVLELIPHEIDGPVFRQVGGPDEIASTWSFSTVESG